MYYKKSSPLVYNIIATERLVSAIYMVHTLVDRDREIER